MTIVKTFAFGVPSFSRMAKRKIIVVILTLSVTMYGVKYSQGFYYRLSSINLSPLKTIMVMLIANNFSEKYFLGEFH